MSARFLLAGCLLLTSLTVARADEPKQEDVQRLREENLKLREALAEQQKRSLEQAKQAEEQQQQVRAALKAVQEARLRAKQQEEQARQTVQEFDTLKKDSDVKAAVLVRERDAALTARDDARLELKRKLEELALIKADGTRAKLVEKLQQQTLTLIQQKDAERKARIQTDAELQIFKARAAEMETQVRNLTREIALLKAGVAPAEPRKPGPENPPEEKIEGRVVQVDKEAGLVKISIGIDAGLKKGHTLKVFRLPPKPEELKYLGVLEVVSLTNHEAVARFKGKPADAVRPGDRIAARLLIPEKN